MLTKQQAKNELPDNFLRSQCRHIMIEAAKVISKASLLSKLLASTHTQLDSHIQRCDRLAKQIMLRTDFYSKFYFETKLAEFCLEA